MIQGTTFPFSKTQVPHIIQFDVRITQTQLDIYTIPSIDLKEACELKANTDPGVEIPAQPRGVNLMF